MTTPHTERRCSFGRRRESRELPLIRGLEGHICRYCVAERVEIIGTRHVARSYWRRGLSRRSVVQHARGWRRSKSA